MRPPLLLVGVRNIAPENFARVRLLEARISFSISEDLHFDMTTRELKPLCHGSNIEDCFAWEPRSRGFGKRNVAQVADYEWFEDWVYLLQLQGMGGTFFRYFFPNLQGKGTD